MFVIIQKKIVHSTTTKQNTKKTHTSIRNIMNAKHQQQKHFKKLERLETLSELLQ